MLQADVKKLEQQQQQEVPAGGSGLPLLTQLEGGQSALHAFIALLLKLLMLLGC